MAEVALQVAGRTHIVACRGEPDNAPETINSLTFAARAKAVKLGKATQRAAPKGPAKAKK